MGKNDKPIPFEQRPRIFHTAERMNERELAKAIELYWRGQPTMHACIQCGNTDRFMITVDNDPYTGLAIITCTRCKKSTPPFELRKPQMRDQIDQRLGLNTPDPHLSSTPKSTPIILDLDPDGPEG